MQRCLLHPKLRFLAVFCCGGAPDMLALDAAVTCTHVQTVVLLLDGTAAMATSADGAAVLRTAVAAAGEHVPFVTHLICPGATGPQRNTEPQLKQQAAPQTLTHESGSAPAGSRGDLAAVETAVGDAVQTVLGAVPAANEPLMPAGLTSAGAVQLTSELETALGRSLPGVQRL